MTKENYEKLMVAIYGFMQIEMKAINLLDKDGLPTKDRKRPLPETESITLYKGVGERLKRFNTQQIQVIAKKVNDIVMNTLVNNDGKINNYLLAMMLYREYLDLEASPIERNRFANVVGRQIRIYEELEGEGYAKTRKETYRVANNLFRILTGKPQLDNELRDLMAKRWLKND